MTNQTTETTDRTELIKRTVARGCNDDDLQVFLHTAQRLGLDPFARQIYTRWDDREKRMQTLVTIDGFRAIAERTGESDGQDGPYWCGSDGVWRDVWLAREAPLAARVIVYRKGHTRGYVGIATWASFAQLEQDGTPNKMWWRMADVMLAKCAEAVALRKAFPAQLSGVYSPEEMAQAANPTHGKEPYKAARATSAPAKSEPDGGEQLVQLDGHGMTEVFKKIAASKTCDEHYALGAELARLVPKQRAAARTAWKAKRAAENWLRATTVEQAA